jgi:hypothetical protein
MDASSVTICRSNTDCVIGIAEGVAVAVWLHHTNVEDVAELGRAVRKARRGASESVRLVQVVPRTAITPDARVRAALASMLRGLKGIVPYSVILFEAEGFRAAMIRSIVTSITSLSSPGFPHRVFGNLQDAAAWMCSGDATPSARQIEEVVQRVRSAVIGTGRSERGAKERSPAANYR